MLPPTLAQRSRVHKDVGQSSASLMVTGTYSSVPHTDPKDAS